MELEIIEERLEKSKTENKERTCYLQQWRFHLSYIFFFLSDDLASKPPLEICQARKEEEEQIRSVKKERNEVRREKTLPLLSLTRKCEEISRVSELVDQERELVRVTIVRR
ncbi:hypothetical protein ACOSQ2_026128 [Xanthoceras sorbifolium]